MPIIRKQLLPDDVFPSDLRYNEATGTVQSLINGEWVDNPAADPRTQTKFPPRVTLNTRCDAAQSVTDAFHRTVDDTITAVGDGATAVSIAGSILALFEFGPFGIFIAIALAIARAMISAGATALTAAMTSDAYDQFKCVLYCHMDSAGRLRPGDLSLVESEIESAVGGLAAIVFNAMLSLAGEGGVNNLASLGSSTGDCSDCTACGCDLANWFAGALATSFCPPQIASSLAGTETARTDTTISVEAVFDAEIYGLYRASVGSGTGCAVGFHQDAGEPVSFSRWYAPGTTDAGAYSTSFPATCAGYVIIMSYSAFTVTFSYEAGAC